MKATILERNVMLKCKLPTHNEPIAKLLGEVDPLQILPGDPMCDELLGLLPRYGLRRRDPVLYSSPSFLRIHGSVGWHEDYELGNLLSWFVNDQPIGNLDSASGTVQLITKSTVLDLLVGDVFVFNSSFQHAWLSNSTCTLLQVTVSGRAVQQGVGA